MRRRYDPRASAAPDQDQPSATTPATAATCTPQNARAVTRTYPTVGAGAGIAAADPENAAMSPGCQARCQGSSGLRHDCAIFIGSSATHGTPGPFRGTPSVPRAASIPP